MEKDLVDSRPSTSPSDAETKLDPHSMTPGPPPPFEWSQLWRPAVVNPVNSKSYTIPIFNLADPYARALHLSWLGSFVAFLSWFAFPPLLPEAIKEDLHLTHAQVSDSNVIALTASLIVRIFVGPLVDQYGPRKVLAAILILGAIPSALAGTAHDAPSLYVIRFFIGILGATFVPSSAWTSAFFDKECVGTANAFSGGWGNMGGGATYAIMCSLYEGLRATGLTPGVAWRASFAIVPAPILLFVAVIILIFGKDHPAGKWSERHNMPPPAADQRGLAYEGDNDLRKRNLPMTIEDSQVDMEPIQSSVDVAVNKPLTFADAVEIFRAPITWLPALAYFSAFGVELLINAKIADVLFRLFHNKIDGFDQKIAGYYASTFGLLNMITRLFGGYLGDVIYRRYGTVGKKFLTVSCGVVMGTACLAGGLYLAEVGNRVQLPAIMGVFAVSVIFAEAGNGANFSLVPHCNPCNNGVMSGIVGAFGNLGGIVFTLIYRFQTAQGKAFWIIGLMCVGVNLLIAFIRVPRY